ncbi:MAG TPA: hypothetical protein PLN85_00430 [archaeon]|nr:hypothetical protein [archaeon]
MKSIKKIINSIIKEYLNENRDILNKDILMINNLKKIILETIKEIDGDIHFNDKQNNNYIHWNELTLSTKNDICENLRNNIKYLQNNYWNSEALRDMIEDSIIQPTFKIEYKNVNELYKELLDIGWNISSLNLNHLINKIRNNVQLDPILLNNNKFYDGGHRLTAYKKLGINKIPTIDIGNLLNFDWEKWDNGEISF